MLITLPDGSHRNVPGPQDISPDIENLVAPRELGRLDHSFRRNQYQEVSLGGGLFFFRIDTGEGRGEFKQRGTLEDNLADFASSDIVYDDFEIARHSFLLNKQGTSPLGSAMLGGRTYGAQFGTAYAVMFPDTVATQLYLASSASPPVMSLQAGFTKPAGATFALCMEDVQVNGAPALMIGWDAGATYSLQVITSLGPFTTSLVPVGPFATYGLCQTPVDGNAIQVYTLDASGGIIARFNTNVALGSMTLEYGQRIPQGGYTVGMVNLDGNPDVFYVAPKNGEIAARGSTAFYTFRGALYRASLRADYVAEVTTQLPYVLWATRGANGIFYCDGFGTHHRWMVKGADIPVETGADRPSIVTGANWERYCTGHHRVGDRFFWTEAVVDKNAVQATRVERYEYDTKTRRMWPAMQQDFLPGLETGLRLLGGPDCPVHPLSGFLLDYVDAVAGGADQWWAQYQPPSGEMGYTKRHRDGFGAANGEQFTVAASRYSPKLRSRGHPGARIAIAEVIGPPLPDVRTGTDAGETGSDDGQCYTQIVFDDGTGMTVLSRETGDQRPRREFPVNDSWRPEIGWHIVSQRAAVGSNSSRYTPNPAIWTISGYIYDPSAPPVSPNYRQWGRNLSPPPNMTESLL